MRHLIPAVVLVLLAGCASASDPGDGAETSVTDSAAFTAFVDDQPTVDLEDIDNPEPLDGFTQDEVDAFADKALNLLSRSISPDLQDRDPDAAVRTILRDELPDTRTEFREKARSQLAEDNWHFLIATLPEPAPTEPPRVIDFTWKVDTINETRGDGETAPVLQVWAQAHVVHTFGQGDDRRLTVTRRHVAVAGFEPLGGPAWWPSIGAATSTWGADDCRLIVDNELSPGNDDDLTGLRDSLESESIVPNPSDPEEFKRALADCNQERSQSTRATHRRRRQHSPTPV